MAITNFSSCWTDWKIMWALRPYKSIEGKLIWGRIMVRKNTLVLEYPGGPWYQYATKKEIFMMTLKYGDV